MLISRTISQQIERPWRDVYAFLAVPENFPAWAAGLGRLSHIDGRWIADTPVGPMEVRFTPRNDFGIVDHHVVPPSGPVIYIPLRVIENGDGAEIAFTLFRQPEMTDAGFEADAALVAQDLAALKALLED